MSIKKTIVRRIARAVGLCLVVALFFLSGAPQAKANSIFCPAFETEYKGGGAWPNLNCAVLVSQNDCKICHNTNDGGNVGSPPDLNNFGLLVQAASSVTAASVVDPDTDSDGWTNGDEATLGTFPDNASSKPLAPSIPDEIVTFNQNDSLTINVQDTNSGGPAINGLSNVIAAAGNVSTTGTGINEQITWNPGSFLGDSTTITYSACNPTGCDNLIQITLNANAPVPAASVFNILETDTFPFALPVTANDDTGGTPTSIQIVAMSLSDPLAMAAVSVLNVNFTPAPGSLATVTFRYTSSNSTGGPSAGNALVTVNINAVLPVPVFDTASVDAGGTIDIDVLANDSTSPPSEDISLDDSDRPDRIGNTVTVVNAPGPKIRYMNTDPGCPNPGDATCTDVFSYFATNTVGRSVQSVTVTVTINNIPVVAVDDGAAEGAVVEAGNSVDIQVTNNDTGGAAETISIVSQPANGTVVVNGLIINYTPDPGFIGPTDSFEYSALNGAGDPGDASNQAIVTVDIGIPAVIGTNPIRNGTADPALFPVAESLDNVCVDLANLGVSALTADQSDLLSNCVVLSLAAANGNPIDTALHSINNEDAFAASTVSIRIAQTGINNINQRLGHIRAGGARGFDVAGLLAGYKNYSLPVNMVASIAENAFDLYFPTPEDMRSVPWGFFINGGFSLGDQTATSNEPGFDFDSRGVTMGGDYIFSERFALGAAFTFSNTAVGQIDGAGEIAINGRSVSLYGFMSPAKNLFIEWQAGYGTSNYDSKRNIRFTAPGLAIDRQAIAAYDGYQVSALVSGVYDFRLGAITISPNVEATYIEGTINPYNESRAGGFNLAVNEQNYSSLNVAGGMRMSYSFKTPFGSIKPRVLFKFNHEFLDDVRAISQNFVSAPAGTSLFEIRSDVPDTDFYTLGGGVEATFGDNFSGFVDYSTLKDLDEVTNHSFTAGIRIRF